MTFSMRNPITIVVPVALSVGAVSLSGCGSVATGNTQLRAVDTVLNGGSAVVLVNGFSYTGLQSIPNGGASGGAASSYVSVPSGSTTLSFHLGSGAQPAGGYTSVTTNLGTGPYSAILLGDTKVTTAPATGAAANGYPQLLVLSNSVSAPPSGFADVRFIDAALSTAPTTTTAAQDLDAYVNGTLENYTTSNGFKTTVPLAYGAAPTGYVQVSVPTGKSTVYFDLTGTTTPLGPQLSTTLLSGHQYTVFLLQTPSLSTNPNNPIVYQVWAVDDTP